VSAGHGNGNPDHHRHAPATAHPPRQPAAGRLLPGMRAHPSPGHALLRHRQGLPAGETPRCAAGAVLTHQAAQANTGLAYDLAIKYGPYEAPWYGYGTMSIT